MLVLLSDNLWRAWSIEIRVVDCPIQSCPQISPFQLSTLKRQFYLMAGDQPLAIFLGLIYSCLNRFTVNCIFFLAAIFFLTSSLNSSSTQAAYIYEVEAAQRNVQADDTMLISLLSVFPSSQRLCDPRNSLFEQ